jgi:hypothetical protein
VGLSINRQQIELSFELTLADVLAARRFWLSRSMVGWLLPLLVVVALGQAFASGSWPFAVGAVLWAAAMGYLVLYFQPRRSFRANPSLGASQAWVLGPDELSCETTASDGTQLARTEWSWRSVLQARESNRAFLLSPTRGLIVVLPKRALDPSALDDLRALIAANVTT